LVPKDQGKKLGRPEVHATTLSVQAMKAEVLGLGIATIKRHWNKLNHSQKVDRD